MTPRIVCGMPRLIAKSNSSALAPFRASGPLFTICCHNSQFTGAAASVAEAEIPATVPGARFGFTVEGRGEEGMGEGKGDMLSTSSVLVEGALRLPPLSSCPSAMIVWSSPPPSSRILKSLNWSFRLFRNCLLDSVLAASPSLPSKRLGPSELLKVVATDAPVFLRFPGIFESFCALGPLESHENGLVSFLEAVASGCGWD